jgi:hypothetical protein
MAQASGFFGPGEGKIVRIGRCLACLLIAAGMISGAWSAQAETEVDLALVLAVDVSLSMEPDEQDLQRQGFIEAFRSPEVHDAIRKGMLGRIAVVYVEWAGAAHQEVIVPWTVVEQPEDALGFASSPTVLSVTETPYPARSTSCLSLTWVHAVCHQHSRAITAWMMSPIELVGLSQDALAKARRPSPKVLAG